MVFNIIDTNKIQMNRKDNYKKGKQFEKYVRGLYETLGYIVKSNQMLKGQQVDLIVTKLIDGYGPMKFIIECKYLEKGSVSNQNILDFNSFIQTISGEAEQYSGIIVTNRDFSEKAHSSALNFVKLKTIQELENEIFNLTFSYLNMIKEYENEDVYYEYIPLEATNNNILIEDLEHWLYLKVAHSDKSHSNNFLILFGDYGSGKTTTLKRLHYRLSDEYCKSNSGVKPFYLELKNYYNFQDMNSFLQNSFIRQFNKDINYELLLKAITSGEFVLLLDGFDEMTPQSNRPSRLENFRCLVPLIMSNSDVILSCRPSYFVSKEEFNSYLDILKQIKKEFGNNYNSSDKPIYKYRYLQVQNLYTKLFNNFVKPTTINWNNELLKDDIVIYLKELSDNQINLYLHKFQKDFQNYCDSDWKDVKNFLLDIYDISDLIKKPILLKIIIHTIIKLGPSYKNLEKEYGLAQLYTIYTNLNLDIDWEKGITRRFLSIQQRKEFAQALALTMFDNNSLDVSFEQIYDLVTKNKVTLNEINKNIGVDSTDEIAADVQICTFLTRTEQNMFKFIHKSFMEYFLAAYLKDQLLKENIDSRIRDFELPKEILAFIGSFCFVEKKLSRILLRNSINTQHLNLSRNMIISFLYSNLVHSNMNFNDYIINFIDFNKLSFNKICFTKTILDNVQLESCIFSNTQFIDCNFENSAINNSEFINVHGNIKILDTQFSDSKFIYTVDNKKNLSFEGYNCSFIKVDWQPSPISFSGSFYFNNCNTNNFIFIFNSGTYHFTSTNLINVKITSKVLLCNINCIFENSVINNSEFINVHGNIKILASRFSDSRFIYTIATKKNLSFEGNNCTFTQVSLQPGIFFFKGSFEFNNCNTNDCRLIFKSGNYNFNSTLLENVTLISKDRFNNFNFLSCQISNCRLENILFSIDVIEGIEFIDCKGYILISKKIERVDEEYFIIINGIQYQFDNQRVARINSKLIIINILKSENEYSQQNKFFNSKFLKQEEINVIVSKYLIRK